jgi:hypothetical protein
MPKSECSSSITDACKFCKREFWSTPNPLIKDPGPGDLLPRRRPRGLECSVCDAFLIFHPKYSAMERKAIKSNIDTNDQFSNDYMSELEVFETKKRNNERIAKVKKGGLAEVKTFQTSEIKRSMHMGYFWPTTLYENLKGSKPDKGIVTTIKHNGKKMSGVILDKSHGKPIGCIKLTSDSTCGASSSGLVVDSSNIIDDAQYDKAWESAQGKLRGSASSGADGVVSLSVPKTKTGKDEDSDDDFMKGIWGGGIMNSSKGAPHASVQDGEHDNPKKSQRTNKASSTSSTKVSRRSLDTSTGADEPSSKKRKGGCLLVSELDKCDTSLLKFTQMKSSLAINSTLLSATVKGVTSIQQNIESRLGADLIKLYSEDADIPDGQFETRGVATLARLREAEKQLRLIVPLMTELRDDSGNPETLLSHLEAALKNDIKVAKGAADVVLSRTIAMRAKEGDWQTFLNSLNPAGDTRPGVSLFKLFVPNSSTADIKDASYMTFVHSYQETSIVKVVNDLLLTGSDSDQLIKIKQLVDFASLVLSCTWLQIDGDVKQDLTMLSSISKAALDPDSHYDTSDQLEMLLSDFERRKSGVFYKGFSLFPTGQHIATAAKTVIDKVLQDKSLRADLASAEALSKQLKDVSVTSLLKDGDIVIPQQAKWIDLSSKLFNFIGNGSKTLQSDCVKEVLALNKRSEELRNAILDAIFSRFNTAFPKVADEILNILDDSGDSIKMLDFMANITKAASYTMLPPKLPLHKFLGKEVAKMIEDSFQDFKSFWSSVGPATPWFLSASGKIQTDLGLVSDVIVQLLRSLIPRAQEGKDSCQKLQLTQMLDNVKGMSTVISKWRQVAVAFATDALKHECAGQALFFRSILLTSDDLDSVFDEDIVGKFDPEAPDSGFDYDKILAVHFGHITSTEAFGHQVKLAHNESTDVMVNVKELCLGAPVFCLCRQIVFAEDMLKNAGSSRSLLALITDASNRGSPTATQVSLLAEAFTPRFLKMLDKSALKARANLESEGTKCLRLRIATTKATDKFLSVSRACCELVRKDIDSCIEKLSGILNGQTFQTFDLDNFNDEQMVKSDIDAGLKSCANEDAVFIYVSINKLESTFKSTKSLAESFVSCFGVDSSPMSHNLTNKKWADLIVFVDAFLKDKDNRIFVKACKLLAYLTAFQALYRPLAGGESRKGLAQKCIAGFSKRPLLSVSPGLLKALEKEASR